MLKKDAIKVVQQERSLFFSLIFVVPKKDSGHHPVINLKYLYHYIPYSHFKNERVIPVETKHYRKGTTCAKINIKDVYFSGPLNQKTQKFVSFKLSDPFYQFLCLYFGLRPAPKTFIKLMRIPISLLRKLYVQLIIFLDDILLMASSKEELTLARDTLIYLLQNLGFLINCKKSVLKPVQNIQFLGMEIDSM